MTLVWILIGCVVGVSLLVGCAATVVGARADERDE